MKRVILLLVLTGFATVVALSQNKEVRHVSGFTGINASDGFDITISKGSKVSLVIESDDEDLIPNVQSEVKNGVLHLFVKKNYKKNNLYEINKKPIVSIVMPNLDNVVLSGACKLTANDIFTPDNFKASCSGACTLILNINTETLKIEASGASKIQIKANVFTIASLICSGASQLQGELITYILNLSASGVSSFDLKGSATNANFVASGTSKVMAEKFEAIGAIVVSSGTSILNINVINSLNISSSGFTSINYRGSPDIKTNISGSSKITQITNN